MDLPTSFPIKALEANKEWLNSKIIWSLLGMSHRHTTKHTSFNPRLGAIGKGPSLWPPTHDDALNFPLRVATFRHLVVPSLRLH